MVADLRLSLFDGVAQCVVHCFCIVPIKCFRLALKLQIPFRYSFTEIRLVQVQVLISKKPRGDVDYSFLFKRYNSLLTRVIKLNHYYSSPFHECIVNDAAESS